MPKLRDMPIKRKLMVIILMTTTAALLLAGIGILVFDSVFFKAQLQNDLQAQAQIIADNSTAAVSFEDAKSATEMLGALRERPHIVSACIARTDGTTLASYVRPGAPRNCPVASPTGNDSVFAADGLVVTRPILLKDRRIGTMVLLYDLGEIDERIQLFSGAVLAVMVVSSLLAFLLSSSLREVIATPISQLVRATKSVSETGDYSIRAQKLSGMSWACW